MDIYEFIQNRGTKIVPNPLYNPKSKKNKEPKNIIIADTHASDDYAVNMAVEDFKNQYTITPEEDATYAKYGLNYSLNEDMNKLLAESQSAWKKWGNGIAQTFISEIGLGTIKAFSDVVDLIGQATTLTDGDYTNPVSKYLEEKQEEFRKFAPVYVNPDVNITNGGLLDAGWWGSNIPSIASSLTLLLPSLTITRGAGLLAKASKLTSYTRKGLRAVTGAEKKLKRARALRAEGASAEYIQQQAGLSNFQKFINSSSTASTAGLFVDNAANAAIMRATENYQEASQTYNDMYTQGSEYLNSLSDSDYQNFINRNQELISSNNVDPNDRDAVAKLIAKTSADRTFQIDWLNIGWDILQMYGLQSAWKGARNLNTKSAKVRRADIDSKKYFGKSADEIKALKASRPKSEKIKEWIEDKTIGSAYIIGAQLSEGAEEALNYVAQQEGMTLGNVLLGKEDGSANIDSFWGSVLSGFDDRLKSYVSAPELWDSAFWGVLGGVVFQGIGSKARRIADTYSTRKKDKKAKENLPWYVLNELPENKRLISDIEARSIDFLDYKEKLGRINNNIDIYNSTEKNEVKFDTKEEQDFARNKLKKEYAHKMALRSLRNGSIDMLKSYMSDDNVRKGLVESGIFDVKNDTRTNEEKYNEATQFTNDVLNEINRVEQLYDEELIAVRDINDMIEDRFGNPIPIEYSQIITNNNINNRLELEDLNNELSDVSSRAEQVRQNLANNNKLDPSLDYERAVEVAIITHYMGQLNAKIRQIESKKEEDRDYNDNIVLNNLRKQYNSLAENLNEAERIFATQQALKYIIGEDGKFHSEGNAQTNKESFEYYDEMITNGVDKGNITSAILGQYNTLVQDSNKVLSTIKNISPELNSLYQYKAAIKQRINLKKQDIATTYDEIQEQDNIIANTLNEARRKAIKQANNVIINLYKKYGSDLKYYLWDKLGNKKNTYDWNITDSELKTLDDAIDVLDLTKSYNESLYYELENTFNIIDAVEVGRQQNNDEENEGTVSNTSTSQPTQPTQPTQQQTQPVVPAPTPNNPTPVQPTQPQPTQPQPVQSQPQPQPAQPVQPVQPQQINTIIDNNLEIDNTGNGASVLLNNINEDEYTLEIDNNELNRSSGILIEKLFEIDNVALLAPIIVDEQPTVKFNNNKIEVVKKGTLKQANINNQDDEGTEAKGTPSVIPSTGEVGGSVAPTNIAPASDTSANNGQSSNVATISPVGESNGTVPQSTPAPVEDETKVESTLPPQNDLVTEMNAYTSALGIFHAAAKKDLNVDIDALAANIKRDLIKSGVDTTLANAMTDKAANAIKKLIERKKNKIANNMQSSIDEVIINQSSLGRNEVDAMTSYIDSVREMIDLYAKEVGLEKINGKYYIDLEELLRFVNSSTNSKTTAKLMYNSLATYLQSEDAEKEYALINKEEINNDNFLANVEKTQEERYLEKIKNESTHRIDIRGYLSDIIGEGTDEKLDEESANLLVDDYYKSLDNLSIGDKLDTLVDKDKGYVYLLNSDGKTVGRLAIPSVDPKTGAFQIYNDGWKYKLNSNNGTITSPIKDLFERWLTSSDPSCKEINEIIYEFAFTKPDDVRKQELLDKLESNIEFINANNFFGSKVKDTKVKINGLVKLWRFIGNVNGSPSLVNNIKIKASLNAWLQKLNNSYNAVYGIINNKNISIEVADVNEGELIRIAPDGGIEAYNKALPASEALAGGVRPDINKIGIGDRGTMGVIKVSGAPDQIFAGVSPGNTFVIIPSKSGRHAYVHAYPANVTDDYIGNDAKEILSEIKKEIKKLFLAHAKTKSEKSMNDLVTFLTNVLSMNNNNKSLFDGLTFSSNNRFITIGQSNTPNYVNIYFRSSGNRTIATKYTVGSDKFEPNESGYKSKKFDFDSEEGLNVLFDMLDSLRFRINYAYIESDNVDTMNLNGIATKKNGEFIIKIGDKEFRYNSYNEFILNNNLVRLNTKPNKRGTSNFNRISERSNRANAKLEIRIINPNSSPVEESKQEQEPQPSVPVTPTTYTINEKVIDILNGNNSDKGRSIAALVFTEEQIKALDKLHILPKNIKYDPYFNTRKNKENTNAEINVKTGEVTVGSKWLDMFSKPYERNQAIRKLMHEQVHYLLHSNNANVEVIKEIYNEFKEALNNNRVNNPDAHDLNHLKAYLFENYKDENRRFEEFLVETLTSEELARALNDIDSDVTKYRGRNLFQRILDFLSKLFNWNVREGSLYQKELYTLRNIFNDNIEETSNEQVANENEQITTQPIEQTAEQSIEQTDEQPDDQTDEEIIDVTNTDEEFSIDLSDELMDEFQSTIDEQPIDNNYTEEMQDIKDKSIANDTFMKAPNGNPTNLNERQWLQVRTKKFIDWFGNWIDNPFANNISVDNGTFNPDNVDMIGYRPEFAVRKNGEFIGSFHFEDYIKNKNQTIFKNDKYLTFPEVGWSLSIEKEFRSQGYGKAMYYEAAKFAARNGRTLRSAKLSNVSEDAKRVWESFVRNGYAKLEDNHYIFNNDKLNYSKVVDENGEPLVVYHGGAKVNKFDISGKLTTGAGIQKGIKGAYFTTSLERADFYRDIAEYKLDLMSEGFKDSLDEEVEKGNITKEEADNAFNNFITTTITKVFLNIRNPLINEYEFNIKKSYNKDGTYREVETKNATFINSNDIKDYDGENIILHHKDVTFFNYRKNEYTTKKGELEIEWVATNSNQIKSAESNTGEFSTEDDNIYQSSIDEISNKNNQSVSIIFPSLLSLQNQLPLSERSKFNTLIDNGEFSTSCK